MKIEYHWEDCSLEFKCPKCGEACLADTQLGWGECGCGVKYRLGCELEFEGMKTREQELQEALAESLKLQSHYAKLLNQYDGGERMGFETPEEWMARLKGGSCK